MLLDNFYKWMSSKLEEKHEKWFNVLINCPKCVSGQWALWTYIILEFKNYNLFYHICFIVLTIWFSLILNKIYLWLTN